MIIDLLHNKIVKDTITDAFAASVNDVLVPMLTEKYGEEIEAVTMYEDYIADELLYEGEWYYPLSVKLVGGEAFACWIKWPVNKKTFKNSVPYSFVGEGSVEFEFAGFVPQGFSDKLAGRAIDYDRNTIPVKVDAVAADPLFLSGRYSQTFVDELASQITAALSRALGVTGLENSTMELQLVFAPGTYLEHTSENVTYRRLLLVDKGCQPRDFWVKWTRLDGAFGYRVSDAVDGNSIRFELGEDVSQKIREKEYRFLAGANPDKYQSAMGKKTVTEWRDITKRALKRGDITKAVSEIELEQHADEVSNRLRELLGTMGVSTAPVEVEPVLDNSYDDVAELAMSVLGRVETEDEQTLEEEDGYVFGDVADELPFEIEEAEEVAEEVEEAPVSFDSVFDTVEAEEISEQQEENVFEFSFTDEKDEDEGGVTFEEYTEATDAATDDYAPVATPAIDEEAIRREIEARLRLEYETEARLRAEKEAERLRLEHERLIEENERLARLAREAEKIRLAEEEAKRREEEARRLAEEEKQRELEAKRAEEARIRAEIEEKLRLEAKERERVAEAARMAVEEQRRLEAERAEKELREREAALEREAERLRREEEARRIAEQKRIEAERRREEDERRRREEEEARKRAAIVTKQAKLMFRYSVDLNVIKRIKEVVEQTLVDNNKQKLNIHIKAYPQDATSIVLEIKLPQNEMDLLVSMMKALGGASLGITKIVLE